MISVIPLWLVASLIMTAFPELTLKVSTVRSGFNLLRLNWLNVSSIALMIHSRLLMLASAHVQNTSVCTRTPRARFMWIKIPAGTVRGFVRRFNQNVFSPQPRVFYDLITSSNGELQVHQRATPIQPVELARMADGYGGCRED